MDEITNKWMLEDQDYSYVSKVYIHGIKARYTKFAIIFMPFENKAGR